MITIIPKQHSRSMVRDRTFDVGKGSMDSDCVYVKLLNTISFLLMMMIPNHDVVDDDDDEEEDEEEEEEGGCW
jgi:hypothetical protein